MSLLVLTKSVETVKEYYGSIPTFINIPCRDPTKSLLLLSDPLTRICARLSTVGIKVCWWFFTHEQFPYIRHLACFRKSMISSPVGLFIPVYSDLEGEETLTTPAGVSHCRWQLMSQQAWKVNIHTFRSQMRGAICPHASSSELKPRETKGIAEVLIITVSQHLDHRGPLEALSKALPSEPSRTHTLATTSTDESTTD